jgi:chromosome segregation ATPase
VILTAIVGLGAAALFATGVAPALWHRAVAKFEKQIPPEVQIDQIKLDIAKLDQDIDNNWTLIAAYQIEIENLKKDLTAKQNKVSVLDKELSAAASELEAKKDQVSFEGRTYKRPEAARLLSKQTDYYIALKKEVAAKEKLLSAREQKLSAAMASQNEMRSQKEELKTQVAQLEADLEALKLMRTEKKLPVGEKTRLDKIKSRLDKLQNEVEVEKKANELRENFNGSIPSGEAKEKTDSTDALVRRIRQATGNESAVATDE